MPFFDTPYVLFDSTSVFFTVILFLVQIFDLDSNPFVLLFIVFNTIIVKFVCVIFFNQCVCVCCFSLSLLFWRSYSNSRIKRKES